MAVKLTQPRRWYNVQYISRVHGLEVNHHENYFIAWSCTTKDDSNYIEPDGHPDLRNTSRSSSTLATESLRRYTNNEESCECE